MVDDLKGFFGGVAIFIVMVLLLPWAMLAFVTVAGVFAKYFFWVLGIR